jgi:8-amino-7-oxononanoate synthase
LDLAEEFNCMLLVDEAHATGVMGKNGAGVVEHFGCTQHPLIQIGTLSKALGSLGGYVAGSASLIDFLRNRAPSWIYTTALSPADTAAALAAINIVKHEPQRRSQLWRNINNLKHLLIEQLPNWELLPSESSIFCLRLPTAADAVKVGQQLKTAGIFAPAIRPPTVNTSRIRISVMATHKPSDFEKLVEALKNIK